MKRSFICMPPIGAGDVFVLNWRTVRSVILFNRSNLNLPKRNDGNTASNGRNLKAPISGTRTGTASYSVRCGSEARSTTEAGPVPPLPNQGSVK